MYHHLMIVSLFNHTETLFYYALLSQTPLEGQQYPPNSLKSLKQYLRSACYHLILK